MFFTLLLLLLAAYKLYTWIRRRLYFVNMRKQTVLITGGCSGVGRSLANKLALCGAKVIVIDVSPRPKDLDQRVLSYICDISKQKDLDQVYSAFIDHLPNVIVNNAGIQNGGNLLRDLSSDDLEKIVSVNLLGVMLTTRTFIKDLTKSPGHVINVASCLGLGGLNNLTDYCGTKFGVVGFSEALRLEMKLTAPQVKVTTVCPFLINTGMFPDVRIAHPWLTPALEPEQVADAIIDAIKYRDVEEIWMPGFLRLFPLLRLFPCWVYDRVQMAAGSCHSFNKIY